MTPTQEKPPTQFTGKCHVCRQPVNRGLWCPKCTAVNQVANSMIGYCGYHPSEAMPLFDRLFAPTTNWTDLVATVNRDGGVSENRRLCEVIDTARRWFTGSYSNFLREDMSAEQRSAEFSKHSPGWIRAKDDARRRLAWAIEHGAHSEEYDREVMACLRFIGRKGNN